MCGLLEELANAKLLMVNELVVCDVFPLAHKTVLA